MADSDNDSGGGGGNNGGGSGNINSELSPREQDRLLPIANVSRIMKKALPANAKISKDAKETVQECVSEFISFITGEASDKCQREKRKTINGDDLLWAMTTLGFEDYVDPLKIYLQRFRETEGEKGVSTGVVGGGGGGGGPARDKDAGVGNVGNGGGGYREGGGGGGVYGSGVGMGMVMMGQQQHQGHVYASGGFHQMAANSGLGNKTGPGHLSPGSNFGRPR